MPFCRRCGAVMDEDDAFCSKCGTSVASTVPQAAPVAPVAQPVQQAPVAQAVPVAQPAPAAASAGAQKSKGELLPILQRYRDVLRDIDKLKTEAPSTFASSPSDTPVRYHTFIKFYWPFIVGSIVAFWVIYFISAKMAVRDLDLRILYGGVILGGLVFLGTILGGIAVAKSRQSTANYYAYEYAHRRDSKSKSRTSNNTEMENALAKKRSIEDDLPEELTARYRTYENMCTIVRVIKFEKANTLEEALVIVDKKNGWSHSR